MNCNNVYIEENHTTPILHITPMRLNECPRYSTLLEERIADHEYFVLSFHKINLCCFERRIPKHLCGKMAAANISFENSRLLGNPNGGAYNVVNHDAMNNQVYEFNAGRNPSIIPSLVAFKNNFIVPEIEDEGISPERKRYEEAAAQTSSDTNSIPHIKNWLYPHFRHGNNPITCRPYLETAKKLISFCFCVSQTFIIQKVMNVKKSKSTLKKKYESSVRIGVVAAAIIGSCFGFVEHSPYKTLESIKEDLDSHYTLEHSEYYSQYVLVLCRYIFTFIFPCKDSVNWKSVKDFNVGNFKSTHSRPGGHMAFGIWSNAFMAHLQIDGDNVSASRKMTRGHNFEMAQLLDSVIPGYWEKQSQVSRGYMLPTEHNLPNWEDELVKNRLYPTSQNLYEGDHINITNREREIPSVKRALLEIAIADPAAGPVPPALPVIDESTNNDPGGDDSTNNDSTNNDSTNNDSTNNDDDGGGKKTPPRNNNKKRKRSKNGKKGQGNPIISP